MAAAPVVGIVGLAELRRDLIRLERTEMPKAFVAAGVAVAEPLAARMRAALPVNDRPRRRGRPLRDTVRPAKIRTGAAVRIGTKTIPYAGWVEFGGTRARPHPSTREYLRDGRYIFPAARAEAPEAVRRYSDEVGRIIDAMRWSPPRTVEAAS